MTPISIFYHCYLSGGDPPANRDHAIGIVAEQVDAVVAHGLSDAASLVSVGVSGELADVEAVRSIVPEKWQVHHNGPGSGELPTMQRMQDWLARNSEHNVLYFHTKSAIHTGNSTMAKWRHCMQTACVNNWQFCVIDLEAGKDSVGAHWLTPEAYPVIGKTPYWAGNFWWAKSSFLNTLPKIDPTLSRWEAEVWIGRGPRRPKIKDYRPHWPTSLCV